VLATVARFWYRYWRVRFAFVPGPVLLGQPDVRIEELERILIGETRRSLVSAGEVRAPEATVCAKRGDQLVDEAVCVVVRVGLARCHVTERDLDVNLQPDIQPHTDLSRLRTSLQVCPDKLYCWQLYKYIWIDCKRAGDVDRQGLGVESH